MRIASNSNSMTLGVGSFTTTTRTCCIHLIPTPTQNAKSRAIFSLSFSHSKTRSFGILSNPTHTTPRHLNTPISALNSGFEASITDSNEISAFLTNAKIIVESEDENKIQLRVEVTADQTQKVFVKVLTNLGRTAPPVPGFRMRKGAFDDQENLDVKDRKISTTQTAEELKKSFIPGNEFGFNVIIEPENS
ncbi:hypothetical protein RJT34_31967 [Clitoria ternatea]|uniref:Trigger factor ribosome-binding bacterial domain-containing protein n=1 Tax=Clitoria ternatea TaxID=43366 RepID=A0AAN9EZF7_CLITE